MFSRKGRADDNKPGNLASASVPQAVVSGNNAHWKTKNPVHELPENQPTPVRMKSTWKALQTKRLCLIEQRKPFSYLAFFLTHRAFFKDIAYFSTFEQFAIRLMIDLCAMRK